MTDQPLDLLAFGAHPDDVEIGMGGTLALHQSKGYLTGICDLTLAELSSNGNVQQRQREASLATDILNLSIRDNLLMPDRGLLIDDEKVAVIVDLIRTYRPRLIFAPYFEDRHPDHGHCGKLIEEAYFSAGIKKYEGLKALPAFRPEELYFYFINGFHQPDFVVDISDVHGTKMAALKSYKSQFIQSDQGVETPLTNGYLETVESRDRLYGKETGTLFAEGFKVKRPIKRNLLLGESL
ncbi:bacillithiol biosynthesis deacetylase BshB1 [Scopulibacillus darangshiensis]|uniref:Bacillithiol biosynthesis deacetylase BshB1 n=1 Tax=Scopulibacillus darangshiensis TaxID=442528 RepID=A0A4R2PB50_9BACL|nr:bacillithiol biosynthesis deacetylase BshB1 [Scopulibacillus darangshiensis]TCP31618.1 bacillithiol biosynthesis deacetylase BshB1 [Scopulibacillus darangshiensis]